MEIEAEGKNKKKNIITKSIVGLIIGVLGITLTLIISETKVVGKIMGFVIYFLLSVMVIYELISILSFPRWLKFFFFIPNILNFFLPFNSLEIWMMNNPTRWHVNDFILNQYVFDLGLLPGIGYVISFVSILFPFFFIEKNKKNYLFAMLFFIFLTIITITAKSILFINVDSFWFLVLLFCGPILCDSFAYFGGLTLGNKFFKRKLAPKISPNKTIEGAIIGFLVTWLILFIVFWFVKFNFLNINWIVLVVVVPITLPLIAIVGDLLFSAIKRLAKIKDFSNLLPGHGGLLDRFDSIIITSFVFATLFIFV